MVEQNGTGAPKRRAKLEREPGTVRPRARGTLERGGEREGRGSERVARGGREGGDEPRRARGDDREPGGRDGRGEGRGRPALMGEVNDLNRSMGFVGLEAAAIAMDVASRVLRGAIDRAFDEDYAEPGDLVRGIANEADMAAFDLVDEVRQVPRQLSHRFESSLRSPRADRGERARRKTDAATPADSPEARDARRAEPPRRRPD